MPFHFRPLIIPPFLIPKQEFPPRPIRERKARLDAFPQHSLLQFRDAGAYVIGDVRWKLWIRWDGFGQVEFRSLVGKIAWCGCEAVLVGKIE